MPVYKQAHMNLRIWGCEDARIQASTREPDDMMIQGCKKGHINLKIWGCKDVRIQVGTHEHEDIRMQGCEDTSKCIGT